MHLDLNVSSVEELTRLGATVVDADSFSWTQMADPEGGEFCAFVREGEITRRLYEIGVDTGPSAADSHRIAAWSAEVLGGRAVDDERGFSWVEDIAQAPFETIDFAPVPEPKTGKNRVHLDVTTSDLAALVAAGATVLAPGPGDPLDRAGRPRRQRVLRVRRGPLTAVRQGCSPSHDQCGIATPAGTCASVGEYTSTSATAHSM